MAPLHVKRKFWWEIIFISVLLFLLAGIPSQRKREAATAQATSALAAQSVAVVLPLLPPLALE